MLSIGDLMLNYLNYSLDYIMIVDSDYNIVFNTRYDPRTNDPSFQIPQGKILNQHYFDVYPNLDREESSVVRCMTTGQVVVCKNQSYTNCWGKHYLTNNITVPIRRLGQIVAVVELSQEVNTQNSKEENDFDQLVEHIQRESGQVSFSTIMTKNPVMLRNIQAAKVLATLPNPTLIYGETGTGKEMFAQAIITHSGIARSRVVIQNCAAVPENLIESILFGTEKGAYTGAERRTGLFQEADRGILFLDELSSMPYEVQAKLLRVLQDGTFRPLGGKQDKRVSVKVICAMNEDPVEAMERGTLRKDLFYRLSSSMIQLLPLRERPEDIEMFLDYYIQYFSQIYKKQILRVTPALRRVLLSYNWDGNVRELKNVMEYMVELSPDHTVLDVEHLPAYFLSRISSSVQASAQQEKSAAAQTLLKQAEEALGLTQGLTEEGGIPYEQIMEQVSRALIQEALNRCGYNKTRASAMLGLPRQTLKYKLEKLGLD